MSKNRLMIFSPVPGILHYFYFNYRHNHYPMHKTEALHIFCDALSPHPIRQQPPKQLRNLFSPHLFHFSTQVQKASKPHSQHCNNAQTSYPLWPSCHLLPLLPVISHTHTHRVTPLNNFKAKISIITQGSSRILTPLPVSSAIPPLQLLGSSPTGLFPISQPERSSSSLHLCVHSPLRMPSVPATNHTSLRQLHLDLSPSILLRKVFPHCPPPTLVDTLLGNGILSLQSSYLNL